MGASTSWTFLNNPYNPLSPNYNHFSQYNLHLKLPWIWAENCWSHPPLGPRWSKHPREWCHPPGHAPIPRLHGAPRGSCTNQSRWPMASSGTARLARRSTPARENCPRQLATGEFWWDRKPVHGIIQFIRGRLRTLFLNDIKCSWMFLTTLGGWSSNASNQWGGSDRVVFCGWGIEKRNNEVCSLQA